MMSLLSGILLNVRDRRNVKKTRRYAALRQQKSYRLSGSQSACYVKMGASHQKMGAQNDL